MEGHPHQRHQSHHHLQHLQQVHQHHHALSTQQSIIPPATTETSDRFPQWGAQETKEFLAIRGELDQSFRETKRNKLLWEVVANKMKEKGFHRSAEQCKCKWKNLVTRYKGCETMEADAVKQQFPFYEDVQAIFASRMQMLWAEADRAGGVSTSGSKKKTASYLSSDEEEEEENEEGEEHLFGEHHQKPGTSAKKSLKKRKSDVATSVGSGTSSYGNLREVLEEFMKQQVRIEMQWRESYEAREKERAAREAEWRSKMEALEKERLMMERRWREREEQWRAREDARAEKRDALITALLNKLAREGSI